MHITTPLTSGQRLRSWRLRTGFTQAQLGARLGVTGVMVSHWELGKCRLPNEVLSRLGVDPKLSLPRPPADLRGYRVAAINREVGLANRRRVAKYSPVVPTMKVASSLSLHFTTVYRHRREIWYALQRRKYGC